MATASIRFKSKLHTEALAYAARGIPVFPCWPNTKKPLTPNGFHAATTDRDQIDAWWTEHPDANIAFVPASIGRGVIDLDGEEGMAAWRDLQWDGGYDDTFVVQTPRGGQHWYYEGTVPPSQWAPGRKRCLGTHIDTRGVGSYALLPPSRTADGEYTVLHDRPIAKLPDWIPAKLAPTAKPLKAGNVTLDQPRHIDRAMRMLKARIAKAKGLPDEQAARYVAVEGKGGDTHTYQLCLELKDIGVSQGRIPSLIVESGWNAACRPPWDIEGKESLTKKAANAYTSGQNEPGSKAQESGDRMFATIGKGEDGGITVELTEHGIIEAFTHRYRGELLFDHTVKAWFRFDGNYWRRETTKLAEHYAHKVSVELAESVGADEDRAKVRAALALKRVHVWEAVERGARTKREFSFSADRWNRDKMLLGTPGGTVDLRTGELRKGRAEDYISRITAVAPIPLDGFKAKLHCPRWMTFLREALAGDAEAIRFLQQWGGYVLTGECKEQCFLFVHGVGQSGKSTTFNTIGEILGDYAKNAAPETFTASKHERHPEELARLHGARFVRASETAQGRVWDENRIKSLTGQDTITARSLYSNSFEFLPEFKLTIFGNNAPILKNPDTAMRRRMIVFPFDQAVPEEKKNLNLPEDLKAEWQGILSWLIQGCLDWQVEGLKRPAVAVKATESYFEDQDTFGRFLTDHCELGKDYAVTTTELWAKWEAYARAAQADPGTRDRTFPEKLRQHRFESIKDKHGIRGRGWKGLQLTEDW